MYQDILRSTGILLCNTASVPLMSDGTRRSHPVERVQQGIPQRGNEDEGISISKDCSRQRWLKVEVLCFALIHQARLSDDSHFRVTGSSPSFVTSLAHVRVARQQLIESYSTLAPGVRYFTEDR